MIGRLRFPGAWMWSAWQPDRGMCFNSYLFETNAGTVAVDPLPLGDSELEWIASKGGVKTIVLTNRDHRRGAGQLRERFGARILAHETEAPLFDLPPDGTFADGDEVFPGAFALALPHGKTPGEIALHLPGLRAAVIGDALIGAPAGRLSLLSDEKLENPKRLLLELRRLWGLQLEALLLGDGQPIFEGADAILAHLLESRGGAEVNRINLTDVKFERDAAPDDRYLSEDGEVGLVIGARKLGYRVSKLPPGKVFCPLHSHEIEEEFFFVLEGNPSIRTLRGTVQCRPGDFIAFPTGPRGTHQLRNDSQEDCLVLMVGMNSPDEVCLYPDSDKILVDSRNFSVMLRSKPLLDYYDGE
jgi:uncharacterized cupin superfamily protein